MNDNNIWYCYAFLLFFSCNVVRTDSRLCLHRVGGGDEGGEREERGANINIDD